MTLPTPRSEEGRAGLAAFLADPAHALAAFDFDGTLSPIVPDPATSRLAPGGAEALRRLAGVVGRVGIVTGRAARTVVELGGLAAVPGLVVEGQYGAERWRAGTLHTPEPAPGVAAVRAALPEALAGADPGTWVEDKALSLVVHTRRAADPVGELARLRPSLAALAVRHGLEAHAGRNVVEIRPPGVDKGGALRRLVADDRPASVLFAGDDVGDLPAFQAIERLRDDGLPGLTLCSASAEAREVADRADLVVDGPPGVVGFLTELADAIEH